MSNKAGHQARKRFGQNFLHDPGVIEQIIRAINPKPDDAIVEIGPGLGALTEEILAVNPKLQVVELDRDLIPVLRTKFFNYPEFRIHEADALRELGVSLFTIGITGPDYDVQTVRRWLGQEPPAVEDVLRAVDRLGANAARVSAIVRRTREQLGKGRREPDTVDLGQLLDETARLLARDLELRGPGEILGNRQHGLLDFHFASITDLETIMRACAEAEALVGDDPELALPEHRGLAGAVGEVLARIEWN